MPNVGGHQDQRMDSGDSGNLSVHERRCLACGGQACPFGGVPTGGSVIVAEDRYMRADHIPKVSLEGSTPFRFW